MMRLRCKRVLFILVASIASCFLIAQYNLRERELYKKDAPPMTFSWKSRVKLKGHVAKVPARTRPPDESLFDQLKGKLLNSDRRKGRDVSQQPLGGADMLRAWRHNQQRVVKQLQDLIDRNTRPTHPDVMTLIRRSMVAPSRGGLLKPSHGIHLTRTAGVVDKLLGAKTEGFFVEARVYDGEGSSNTLWLEHMRQWTGLVMEPDPAYFLQLVGKNRQCLALNGCLSTTASPAVVWYGESEWQLGRAVGAPGGRTQVQVPCYPIVSLLRALNRTSVDFLSLDVNGAEMEVLKTIPWKDVEVRTISLRYGDGGNLGQLDQYLERKGYWAYNADHHSSRPYPWDNELLFVRRPAEQEDEVSEEYLHEVM